MAAAVALVGWGLVASACHTDVPPPENQIKDAGLLRAAIEARVEQFSTGRFKEVVLDYYGEDERIKVRQLLLVKAPDKLFVQTRLPGSDEVLNRLVSDGARFSMHRRDTHEYITGPPTPTNISRLLPLDLSARDVVRVMLGGAPWDRFDAQRAPYELAWDGQRGTYRLSVARASGGQIAAYVRPTDFAVASLEETDGQGETVYRYETDDWKRYGTLSLPDWRRFVWPGRDLDFSVDVGETQLGVDLDDSLFAMDPPAGSRVTNVP